jgi:predicted RNA-binding protein YlxR (DUF448 family)
MPDRKEPMRRTAFKVRAAAPADGVRAKRKPRRQPDPVPPEVVIEVLARTDGRCAYVDGEASCYEQATEIHHRKLRSQGGTNEVENLVPLCRFHHHDVIHANKVDAYAEGWLIHGWDVVSPWPDRWFA